MPTSRRGRLLAAVLALVLLAGAAGVAWWRITALPSDAAFRYDGHVVTIDQLDQRIDALRALYGVEQPQDPGKADTFRRDVAKSVAVSEILDKAAADRQIVVADKQVEDTLGRYVEQQFGPGGNDAFVKALGNVGTSESAVRDEIRRQLTVSQLMQQVVGTITISDADLKAAYDQRKGTLGTPEKRTLRNIVVASQQDAQSVLDQLKAGTPIEQVAATRSLDASTRDKGGSLGEVARADLEQPVGDAAFGVGSGQFYGPVQGAHGWNVGRVDAITPFVPATYEQVADGLRQALKVERSLAVWRGWLGQQIHDAGVEYADAYRPADPDAVPSIESVGAPAGGEPPR
ncbi:peptidyl-prolyl cis-trans isomerase [Pseudonocardia acidicola]|uniref:Parvulin peptidyl-prolyl isomerase n=1 Tax=Pseudonocardia acidicola TaxID=2724939 RepID=A0ABX1SJ66_9PSEU|nr:peptidyl-prolyl cis-trans isomerase [Pseudonocardia acidicola]NMI00558.1 parvulin peptidyl-prolyl isomerase [Pseudonocardia acidicola]